MKSPTLAFDERHAEALETQILTNVDDLPVLSEDILEQYGARPIWQEMQTAGFLSERQKTDLTKNVGFVLSEIMHPDPNGTPSHLSGNILRTPSIGRSTLILIANYIRVTYGFEPDANVPRFNKKSEINIGQSRFKGGVIYEMPSIESGLPALNEEIFSELRVREIWHEMFMLGLLTKRQATDLASSLGSSMADVFSTVNDGEYRSPVGAIRRVPQVGQKSIAIIGDYIRAHYGFEPIGFPHKADVATGTSEIDVSELNTRLTEVLSIPLDLTKISPKAIKKLNDHNIVSVGDFLILSSAELSGTVGITHAMGRRIEENIESITKIDITSIRGNEAARNTIRWKYAVLKATMANRE